jgi:HK97 family phage portal protein
LLFRVEKREREVIDLQDRRLLELLGINIDEIDVSGKNALKEATVYACIRILAEAVAKLPIKIYKDTNGIKKATDHYLYNILKLRPNPYMSSEAFFKCMETQRNIYGNSYANIEFDDRGKVKAIWPIAASKVEIFLDNKELFDSSNRMWYVVNLGNEKVKLKPDEILHFKGMTFDGITGITPITYLKSLIQNASSGTDYINKFYQNGMQTKGIIQYVGDLDKKAEETFRAKFEQMSNGLKNAHRVSLLPLGYQFQPISLSMADAQFLENNELTIRQIAAAFGIKMHQLNDLDRATHTNIEEQQRQFYVDTLMANLTMYEQEMTYKLLLNSELSEGYYCKFNVDALTRADIKTRYEAYRVAIQGGILTPNEVRAMEERKAEEGGDQLLVNGNMMPISMAGKQYEKGGGDIEGTEKSKGNKSNTDRP